MHLHHFIIGFLFSFLLWGANDVFAIDKHTELSAEIKTMIIDLSCNSSDDCQSIGFGARACGGYQQYLIYSQNNVDDIALQQKAKMYFKLDQQRNKSSGMMSICSIAQPRVTECRQGNCVDIGDILNSSPR